MNESEKLVASARMGAVIVCLILKTDNKSIVDKTESIFRQIQDIQDTEAMVAKIQELVGESSK